MKRFYLFLFLSLLLANIFVWTIIYDFIHRSTEEVYFLNVGQGDAELVRLRGGNILIDAGPNGRVISQLDKSLPFYDRTIDVFVLSHPNKDHYAGFFDVLERYKVRTVILNNLDFPSSLYQQLLQKIKEKHILVLRGVRGLRIREEKSPVRFHVLYPFRLATANDDANNFSSVDLLSSGKKQFLFTGDIGFSAERKIIPLLLSLPPSSQRILKVPHHGSRYSSSLDFLKAFSPQIAVIEVGRNHYGHPHPDTLQRLQAIGAQVFRTDLNGLIRFKIR